MQKRFRIPIIAFMAMFAVTSCSKTNKEGRYVPKDAAIVVHVNGATLSAKLPWEEVKQNELFKQLIGDTTLPAIVKQILENPDNSGIDTKTDMIFFVQKDSIGGVVAFTGTIKDAAKFQAFNIDISDGGSESDKDGVNYISKDPMCVGWNKERFLYTVNTPELNMQGMYDGAGNRNKVSKARDLLSSCQNLFAIKEDNAMAKNEKFTALVKKTGDLHFWLNSEALYDNSFNDLPMMNLDKLIKGSVTAATVNFENGKIVMDAIGYSSKELSELWKKYSGKNVDEAMLKQIPAKEMAAVIAMNFKPEGIKELMKLLGVEGYANMGLAFMGFSFDDFIKANKGDIVLAVSDFKQKQLSWANGDSSAAAMTDVSLTMQPEVLFATSIGDKDAFNTLIKAGQRLGKDKPAGIDVAYNSNGKYFAIGNNKESIDKFIAGNAGGNTDYISKISGKPYGVFVNLQYILKSFEAEAQKDSSGKAIMDASLKMWENVISNGGNFEDGGMTQHFEINLLDKTTNSLKQLNQYIGKIGAIAKAEKLKTKSLWDVGEESATEMKAVPITPVK
jgi:hypothetical protein